MPGCWEKHTLEDYSVSLPCSSRVLFRSLCFCGRCSLFISPRLFPMSSVSCTYTFLLQDAVPVSVVTPKLSSASCTYTSLLQDTAPCSVVIPKLSSASCTYTSLLQDAVPFSVVIPKLLFPRLASFTRRDILVRFPMPPAIYQFRYPCEIFMCFSPAGRPISW